MLLAPLVWAPGHAKAVLLMAAASMTLLFGAGRYRARLHLSVLDELPTLLSRLLAAGAVVGTLSALTHEQDEIAPFLTLKLGTIAMVVAGRVATTQVLLTARRRRVVAHRTLIVGGGARAAETATLLQRYPQYGLVPVGFVDDSAGCAAEAVLPRLGEVPGSMSGSFSSFVSPSAVRARPGLVSGTGRAPESGRGPRLARARAPRPRRRARPGQWLPARPLSARRCRARRSTRVLAPGGTRRLHDHVRARWAAGACIQARVDRSGWGPCDGRLPVEQ